jgi:hypothetical protein
MRCKNCEYNLWALKTRECPECGQHFVPSEFDFVPGSVRFVCPYCDQSYYGTSARGHLIPAEFDCVQCGGHICMDEMVLFPAEGVREGQTQPEGQPWLERAERGRVVSWFRTIGMAMVAPQKLIRLTPVESSVGAAWWFALLTQFLYSLTGVLPLVVFPLIAVAAMRGGGVPGPRFVVGGVFGGMFLASWLGMVIVIAIWGLVAHAVLLLTGGAEHSVGRTYQAICYSSGANALMAIPCVGLYMSLSPSWIWWVVSATLMVRAGQRVHGGRAALAVLTFPALMLAGVITLVIMISSLAGGRMVATPTTNPAVLSQSVAAQSMADALTAFCRQHNGRPPGHAIELVHGNYLHSVDAFLVSKAETRGSLVPLGGRTLGSFPELSLEEENQVVKAATAGLPPRPVAHRLGDFVFTYHGFNPDSADRNLWLFIIWPDAATGGGAPEEMVVVGLRGGTWAFPTAALPAYLGQQNALRARYGLPPLPHPKDVTYLRPPATLPEMQP